MRVKPRSKMRRRVKLSDVGDPLTGLKSNPKIHQMAHKTEAQKWINAVKSWSVPSRLKKK